MATPVVPTAFCNARRVFLPAFNQSQRLVSATTPPPESDLLKHSIPGGATLTVSPPWRQSLGETSWGAKFARGSGALPAPAQAERRRRPAARRPPARLWGARAPPRAPAALLPRPARPACKDRGAGQPCASAGGRILPGWGWGGSCEQDQRVQPQRLQQRGRGCGRAVEVFWNAGCGPLTQQKRNESARAILTNKSVHCRLRRNFPFLIYIRLKSLFFFF